VAYVEEALRRRVVTCESDGCTATVPELLGCVSYGDTPEAAGELCVSKSLIALTKIYC